MPIYEYECENCGRVDEVDPEVFGHSPSANAAILQRESFTS